MKKVFTLLCFFLLSSPAFAAITLTSYVSFDGTGGTSQTKALTIGVDDNALVVSTGGWSCTGSPIVVTGVTYNGIALTQAIADTSNNGTCNSPSEIWYLLAPPVGTYNVVVTFDGSMGGIYGTAYALKGVKQTSQPDATTANNTPFYFGTYSTIISNAVVNTWVFDFINPISGTISNPGAGQVAYDNFSSYKPNNPVGNTDMSWDYSGTSAGSHILVSFDSEPLVGSGGFFDNA